MSSLVLSPLSPPQIQKVSSMTWTVTPLATWAIVCCQQRKPTSCRPEWATPLTDSIPCKAPTSPPDLGEGLGSSTGETSLWASKARTTWRSKTYLFWKNSLDPTEQIRHAMLSGIGMLNSWVPAIASWRSLLHCLSLPPPCTHWSPKWTVSYGAAVIITGYLMFQL